MVRNLVGTLLEVGSGQRSPADIVEILAARDRVRAGRKAPPQGLFLEEVVYPAELLDPTYRVPAATQNPDAAPETQGDKA